MAATLTKEQILDGIAELSVIELSELLKEFEEKFGVTAAPPCRQSRLPSPPVPVAVRGRGADEKSDYDVILTAVATRRSR